MTERLQYAVRRTDTPIGIMIGLPGAVLQTRLNDVRHVLSQATLSTNERLWIQKIEKTFAIRKKALDQLGIKREVRTIVSIEDDDSAPERLWIQKKCLLDGKLKTLKGKISKEVLLESLPSLQLDEGERRKFEEQINRWE